MIRSRPAELLRLLARHGVEHIVVGGVAAVLHGAPVVTLDLDVVHRRTPENIRRLLSALAKIHASYRTRTDRRFEPRASHLATAGHQLLRTDLGDLDLLGTVGDGLGYEELLDRSGEMSVAGVAVRVLELAQVIALKEWVGRDKDRVTLPMLRETLRLRDRGPNRSPDDKTRR